MTRSGRIWQYIELSSEVVARQQAWKHKIRDVEAASGRRKAPWATGHVLYHVTLRVTASF